MNISRIIHVVGCHAEGEVGDVVVGGVRPPPGSTLWEQSRWLAEDDRLRRFLLNEPRGGVFRHVNLLVPPVHPSADAGFIIMEPEDTPPMSGSNSMCVATVLLETGILPMTEPETRFTLEAPGGLVQVTARCAAAKAKSIRIRNVPSFCFELDRQIEVEGLGRITVDIAYGGDSFAIVDSASLGLALRGSEARQLANLGVRIADAATEQVAFRHPEHPDWRHISFCLFATAPEKRDGEWHSRHAVAIRPGKVDRSPTGTGVSARLAVLHARGLIEAGAPLIAESLIGSRFIGRIEAVARVGEFPAVIPTVEGRAWITGTSQLFCDVDDPWPEGYRINDTWPDAQFFP